MDRLVSLAIVEHLLDRLGICKFVWDRLGPFRLSRQFGVV